MSGVARVVAALGGYMILTMGLMFADFFGYDFGMTDAAVLLAPWSLSRALWELIQVFFDLGSTFTAPRQASASLGKPPLRSGACVNTSDGPSCCS